MRSHKDPWDRDAERAVLGAMVESGRALETALGELTETDFYGESHRAVFRAASCLTERGEAVEQVALAGEVRASGYDRADEARALVFELVDSVPTTAGMPRWIKSLKEMSLRRGVLARAERAAKEAAEGGDTLGAVEDLNSFATDTAEGEGVHTFASGHEAYVERVALRRAGESVMGMPTGLSRLDRATTGWHDGDLIILGGRPGMAKTLFMWQSAITAARHGHKAFVFNLEMAFERIQERCACAVSGVSYEDWRRGTITGEHANRLMRASKHLSELPIPIHNPRAGTTLEDLKRAVKAVGPDVLFVDYLQLLMTSQAPASELTTTVTLVSKALKQLALSANIPIVCAAQLSRDVETRWDKRPLMSDLRQSGQIEQDADVVLMMYRDAYYYPEGMRDGKNGPEPVKEFHPQKVEFIARKDREGGNWVHNAYFSGPAMWLSDSPHEERQTA